MRNGVAQHAQADACNPDSMFSKMSTPASWDSRLRLPNRFPTVSRRFHPVALASAGTAPPRWRSTEPLTRRHDSPVRPVVPGTASVRLESSRPPCGENRAASRFERASTVRQASTAGVRGFRPARDPCISASACAILTTHGHTRRSLRPDCVTFRSRLSPVRVRNDDFHRRCQMGEFKEQPSSLSRASELFLSLIRRRRSTKFACGKCDCFSTGIRLFAHFFHTLWQVPKCASFFRETPAPVWVSRGPPPW